MLYRALDYSIGASKIKVTVPAGFVTDFASIPQSLWSFGLSPNGRYSKAAIIHDYLYWSQTCTKEQSDNILFMAMKESDVGLTKATIIYDGVRLGGRPSWMANGDQRKKQLPRVIPIEYRDIPPDATWSAYRKSLVAKNVRDPSFPDNPLYCKLGNSTEVPN